MTTATLAEQRVTLSDKAAMLRLLDKARAEGVQLKQDSDGNFYATSVSQPGHLHPVRAMSCGCRGFASHGRCKHLAALHQHLGWLEGLPEAQSDVVDCGACDGLGAVEITRSRWIGGSKSGYRHEWKDAEPCACCAGTGVADPAIAA